MIRNVLFVCLFAIWGEFHPSVRVFEATFAKSLRQQRAELRMTTILKKNSLCVH